MKAVDTRYHRSVAVEDLKLGMYVNHLDRPWVETRFLFQGFEIRHHEEIAELRKICQYVVIDVEKGIEAERYLEDPAADTRQRDQLARILQRRPDTPVYPDTTTVEEEMGAAREVYEKLGAQVRSVMQDVRARNPVKVATIKAAVGGMIDSILRNPDAFMWLAKLKDKDSYTYLHSIDTCALAIAFGRHLGLPKRELEHLAVGTLLFDIGKMKLPEELLTKPGKLTKEEFALMQEHVNHSVDLMSNIKDIDPASLEVARTHHERHNGSGYPAGLAGTDIPVFGRIGALVDCYDAITSDRPYARAMSQHEAVMKLYEWRDEEFQVEMIEQFIQCLGVYPTGSLVELSTGEVGIVLSQNRVRRLRPKIMVILDKDKVAYDFSPVIDLATETEDKDGNALSIAQPLETGAYGIEPKDYYL